VDVYSLGVILFRALTGHLPFEEAASLPEKLKAVTTAPRPSLHALRPDLPAQVDSWVDRALAIDRNDRYQNVRELWTGLLSTLHYTPPLRSQRPIADSIVGAWRAATSAFWQFIEGGPSSGAGPVPPSAAPEPRREAPTKDAPQPSAADHTEGEWITASTEEPWLELGDADLEIHSERPKDPPAADLAPPGDSAPLPPPPGPDPGPGPELSASPPAPSPDAAATKKSGKRSRRKKTAETAAVASPAPSSPKAGSSPVAAGKKKEKKRNRRKTR
jgi:serine/threonine-protein kinase